MRLAPFANVTRTDPEAEYIASFKQPGVDGAPVGNAPSRGVVETAAAAFRAASRDPRARLASVEIEELARTTAVYQD